MSAASLKPAPIGELNLGGKALGESSGVRVKGEGGFFLKRTGVIAADVEVVFIGIAVVEDAGFEVVAGWWGGCRVSRGEGEGEGEVDEGEKGREGDVHCWCSFCFVLFY